MMNEKEQLWYTRFLNYANSGMPRTHWCRENGIAISSFRYWCKKFDAMRIDDMQEDTESAASGWYELSCSSGSEMTTQAPRKTGDPIRLQISDLKLEFPAGTDPDILIRICRELMRIWIWDMNRKDLRSICSGKA